MQKLHKIVSKAVDLLARIPASDDGKIAWVLESPWLICGPVVRERLRNAFAGTKELARSLKPSAASPEEASLDIDHFTEQLFALVFPNSNYEDADANLQFRKTMSLLVKALRLHVSLGSLQLDRGCEASLFLEGLNTLGLEETAFEKFYRSEAKAVSSKKRNVETAYFELRMEEELLVNKRRTPPRRPLKEVNTTMGLFLEYAALKWLKRHQAIQNEQDAFKEGEFVAGYDAATETCPITVCEPVIRSLVYESWRPSSILSRLYLEATGLEAQLILGNTSNVPVFAFLDNVQVAGNIIRWDEALHLYQIVINRLSLLQRAGKFVDPELMLKIFQHCFYNPHLRESKDSLTWYLGPYFRLLLRTQPSPSQEEDWKDLEQLLQTMSPTSYKTYILTYLSSLRLYYNDHKDYQLAYDGLHSIAIQDIDPFLTLSCRKYMLRIAIDFDGLVEKEWRSKRGRKSKKELEKKTAMTDEDPQEMHKVLLERYRKSSAEAKGLSKVIQQYHYNFYRCCRLLCQAQESAEPKRSKQLRQIQDLLKTSPQVDDYIWLKKKIEETRWW